MKVNEPHRLPKRKVNAKIKELEMAKTGKKIKRCNKLFRTVKGKRCKCQLQKHDNDIRHKGTLFCTDLNHDLMEDMRCVFERIVGKKVYERKTYGDGGYGDSSGYLTLGGCEITTEEIARLLKANIPFTIGDKIYVWKHQDYM